MPFNTKLKELRLRNKLTQEQLAIKLDVATSTYIKYEKGKSYPSVGLITQMANIFDVSISFLLDEQNEPSTETTVQKLSHGTPRVNLLVEEISSLLAGYELSETDKDAVLETLQKARKAKKETNS